MVTHPSIKEQSRPSVLLYLVAVYQEKGERKNRAMLMFHACSTDRAFQPRIALTPSKSV